MNRITPRPAMTPQHQADLRFVLGVLLALAVLAVFIFGIHISI
jgi:hypothetical protein